MQSKDSPERPFSKLEILAIFQAPDEQIVAIDGMFQDARRRTYTIHAVDSPIEDDVLDDLNEEDVEPTLYLPGLTPEDLDTVVKTLDPKILGRFLVEQQD